MPLNWNIDRASHLLIDKIINRAMEVVQKQSYIHITRPDLIMDITACHANGTPLDLEELLKSSPFDFVHDVFGIRRHLDRETGQLTDCFVPRCALPDAATAIAE